MKKFKVFEAFAIVVLVLAILCVFIDIKGLFFLNPSIPFSKLKNIDIHASTYLVEITHFSRTNFEIVRSNAFKFKTESLNTHTGKIVYYISILLLQFSEKNELKENVKRYVCSEVSTGQYYIISFRGENMSKQVRIECEND